MKISRRSFLKNTGLATAALTLSGCSSILDRSSKVTTKMTKDHPNIIFITTDYQAGEDGPSLGSPFLDMPALDKMCQEGVVFERHYSTAPICMPERATWITGQYPHTHGKWGNGGAWVNENTPTMMEVLSQNGYFTLGIGKMHFHPWDLMGGFDQRIIADRKANIKWDAVHQDDYAKFLAKHSLTRWDYLKLVYQSETPHIYQWPFPEECHIDSFVGDQASRCISEGQLSGKNKPWFMWVSFNGPHNPWDPPAKYSKPYLEMDLPEPRGAENLDQLSRMHTYSRYGYTKEVADYIDRYPERAKEYIKLLRASHYGNLTLIDRKVETIMQALKKRGELEDTIIIWSADHGGLNGDYGNFHKGFIYERSANVPFVVYCPKRFKPRHTKALCGGVDLMPTILSLANVAIPASVEGRDFSAVISGQKESVMDQTIIEISGHIGLVNERWKLFVHNDGEGELYDFKNDPNELTNLYNDPKYKHRKQELQNSLVKFHPDFAAKIAKAPPAIPVYQNKYILKQGDIISSNSTLKPPPQAGKDITIAATLEAAPDGKLAGAFFTCLEHIRSWPGMPAQNGYALYVADNKICLGIRHWHQDSFFTSDKELPAGKFDLLFKLKPDGKFAISINSEKYLAGQADPALPIRPGRSDITAPNISVGVSDQNGTAIGKYEQKNDFYGIIKKLVLSLDEIIT